MRVYGNGSKLAGESRWTVWQECILIMVFFTNITPDHIGPNEHADFNEYL